MEAQGLGQRTSAHAHFFFFGLDATTVSSPPSFYDFTLPDVLSLSPADWLCYGRQVEEPITGLYSDTGTRNKLYRTNGNPRSGRAPIGQGRAEWAVLPQSACGRGSAAAEASTAVATTFLSFRCGLIGAGTAAGRARLSAAAALRRGSAAPWGDGRRAPTLEARGGGGPPALGDLRRGPGVGRPGAGVVPGSAGPRGGARRSSGSRRPGPPRGAAAGRWAPPPGRLTTTLPREPSLRRTRRRRRRGRGRPRRMEERKEEGEAEIQEHGPEHWFSKWERQCLAEAEQDEQLPPELQDEAAAGAQPEHKQQKLWHLFQNSATAVAQLYKGEGRRRAPRPPSCRRRLGPTLGRGPRAASPARPPPRCPLLTRWRRGGRAAGAPGGGRGRRGGGLLWGPAPRRPPAPRAWLPGGPGRGGQGRSPQSQNGEGRRQGRPYCARSRPRGGDRAPPCAVAGPRAAPRTPRLPFHPSAAPFSAFLPVTVGARNPGTKWRNLIWPFLND